MADGDNSLDKYYEDSDEDDNKDHILSESDGSIKALKKKLEALKNNDEDSEQIERSYQEDLKKSREKKQNIERQKQEQNNKVGSKQNQNKDEDEKLDSKSSKSDNSVIELKKKLDIAKNKKAEPQQVNKNPQENRNNDKKQLDNKQKQLSINNEDEKYYENSDQDDNKVNKSSESDNSIVALKKKLEAIRNKKQDPEEAERSYQEDLKRIREQKQREDQQRKDKIKKKEEAIEESYGNDFGSDEEIKSKISNDNKTEGDQYGDFELQSNSFSIHSKQSVKEEDNLAYTLQQTRKNSVPKPQQNAQVLVQSKTPIVPKKVEQNTSKTALKPIARPVTSQQKVVNKDQQNKLSLTQGVDAKRLAKLVKDIKTSVPDKKEQKIDNKPPPTPNKAKITQHQNDMLKKKQENEESEKKLEKQPKLPNIQSKNLKVNNFMKAVKEEQKKPDTKKQEGKQLNNKPKDELDEDIFGEDEKEKGDQALAPGNEDEDSEEANKLKERQRRQQILKEQKEKRKDQLDNQGDKVKQIYKSYEEKQQQLKEKEDQFYVREAVEKMKQKKVKQNLTFENEESNWVNITRKDYTKVEKEDRAAQQDKFRNQMLENLKKEEENLNKKKINDKVQSKVSTKTELKEKNWNANIASKKGTINEISKIESEKNDVARENEYVLLMKKLERKKYLEQLETEKRNKMEASKFVKEGQDNLKQRNRALDKIDEILKEKDEKKKKEKEKNYQYEESQKEKREADIVEIKKLKVILRQLNEENRKIKNVLSEQKEKQEKYKAQISKIKNKDGVVVLGENKFTSFGLVPALSKKQELTDASTNDEESTMMIDKINDQEKRYLTQLTVIELIVHKITEQGLTLSDIFSLLDFNKDGILTIQEIEINMGKLDLNLTEEEIQEMIKIIDTNKDGVINEFEFVKNLETQYQSQKEYNRVMGELRDIQNPIVLQERVLDLEVRQRVVLKCMKKEEEKEVSKGPDYQKYLERLKKHEDAYEKRQKIRNKGKDMSDLTAKAGQLKLQLKKLEDEKELLVIMQKERMEAISENISKLTEELMQMSEIVIKAKNVVDKERNDYQKLVIKQVAIDRLQEQVNEQRRQKEIEQQKQALKFQSNIKQKAKNIHYEQQQKMSVQNVVGAAILLQKIYRGWKSRVVAKKRKEALMRAVQFIQVYYWWYSKKKKIRTFVAKLDNQSRRRKLLVLKMFQAINFHMQKKLAPRSAFIALRSLLTREEYAMFDQRQVQIQQYLNKNKQLKPGNNDDIFGQEDNESGVNSSSMQQYQQPLYEKKTKKGAQDLPEDFRPQELPAVITLQRGLRRFKKSIGFSSNNKVTFTMGGISPLCRICNTTTVQILCRSCEQCIFCKSCYDKFHKSYHRRNHRFYELNADNYSKYDTGLNKEDVYKALKNYIEELKKLFQMDMNTGFFPLEQVLSFFEIKVEAFNKNKNLLEQAYLYIDRYVVEEPIAFQGYKNQNVEHKFDITKKYIDHIKFIRSFHQFNKENNN